jgi:tetratricopeptide (TPR) repeat protein
MAIKGSLAEASLPDVIQLLSYSGKSGCLSVTDGRNFGNIFIKDGRVVFATILNRKQKLGDILLTKQLIDDETLNKALEIRKASKNKRLGEIMIEMGALSREVLDRELRGQIEQTIFTMLTWETGYFNFEADLLPLAEDYTLQLSAQELLLEGARRIDEWKKIENKIPPFETVLVRNEDAQSIPLTQEEEKIMELVDGVRTIDDILKLSEYDFFATCRTLYGLLSAGLLMKPEKPLASKHVSGDITEYKNLGFAFYKTEMYDEAEREYRKILDIDGTNPEAFFYLGLIELMRGDMKAAREQLLKSAEKEKRASVLTNAGYVCVKMECYDEAIAYLQTARELTPDNTKMKCNLAIALYKKGNNDEAETILREVINASPATITPYMYLPSIYMAKNDPEEAERVLKEAIDHFPRMILFKNNLAALYEDMDKPEEAEKLYRQALEVDPHNKKICRNLAEFYYRTQILGAARELFEKIAEAYNDWGIFFKLGNIHLRQGDTQKALQYWYRAKELNPSEELIARNIEVLTKSGGK